VLREKQPARVVNIVTVSQIVDLPELKKPMLAQGVALKSSSAEAFHKLVAEDIGKLSKIVKAAGIKVD